MNIPFPLFRPSICLRCHARQLLYPPRPLRLLRPFTTTSAHSKQKAFPPRRQIPDSELEESFLKGSGPGGQKINKTNSAVQLKHLPTGVVVKCQSTRSRDQNRKTARRILADKLEEMELGESSRAKMKEREAARRKASKSKKARRKYRALEEGKDEVEGEEREEGEGEEVGGTGRGGESAERNGDSKGVREKQRSGKGEG